MKERCLSTDMYCAHCVSPPLLINVQQSVLFDPEITTQLYQLVAGNYLTNCPYATYLY